MNASGYHFRVGEFKCMLISDGTLTYTTHGQDQFINAPRDELKQALLRHDIQFDLWNEFISPLPCLLIQTEKHKVLVDTGLGKVDFAANAGLLIQNLNTEGIDPADIDFVILTHAHGDHIGWNSNTEGWATFPNARYIMRKEEWDFWRSEKTLAQPQYEWMTPFVQRHLLALSRCFELLPSDEEIVPGHTPGHMAVILKSQGEQLLCIGDVLTHPLHTERPDWHLDPDCQPDQAINKRRQVLDRAAATQTKVFVFHFEFPGIRYVRREREAWQ